MDTSAYDLVLLNCYLCFLNALQEIIVRKSFSHCILFKEKSSLRPSLLRHNVDGFIVLVLADQ